MSVVVSFRYEPAEPDDHEVGMSNTEYEELIDALMSLGAEAIEVARVES